MINYLSCLLLSGIVLTFAISIVIKITLKYKLILLTLLTLSFCSTILFLFLLKTENLYLFCLSTSLTGMIAPIMAIGVELCC